MKKYFLSFLVLITAITLTSFAKADVPLQSGFIMPQAKSIQPFVLDHYVANPLPGQRNAQSFTNANLQGQWTLMFFGFTNCPALCPTTMAQLSNAYQQLQTNHFIPMPQVVFVSVDPRRDTIKKVNVFATTFNHNFIGARTDNMNTLLRMTTEMNAMFEKVNVPARVTGDKDKNSNYTINHTGDIMVLNPQGQFVAVLTMPHEANNIVADYQAIVKNAAQNQSSGATDRLKDIFGKI